MNIDEIKIGQVYGNGKGLFRKVRCFSDIKGQEVDIPMSSYIHYVRCSDSGAVRETAKEQKCWCSTFADWAKERG